MGDGVGPGFEVPPGAAAFRAPAIIRSVGAALLIGLIVNHVFPQVGILAATAMTLPVIGVILLVIAMFPFVRGTATWSTTVENDLRASFQKDTYKDWTRGWLLPNATKVSGALQKVTPSYIFRLVVLPKRYRWVFNDTWVAAWFLYAIFAFFAILSMRDGPIGVAVVIVAFGAVRLFEIISYQVDFTFFTALTRIDEVSTFQRTALLTLINYFEIVLWFAVLYALLAVDGLIVVDGPPSLVLLDQSLVESVANSDSAVHLSTSIAWTVSLAHKVVGLFMTSVVLSRVIGMLRPPGSLEDAARPPVVESGSAARADDVPT